MTANSSYQKNTQMTNIVAMVQKLAPNAPLDKTLDSLNKAWRRSAERGAQLGKFDRRRDDLNPSEVDFILDWLNKPTQPMTSNAIVTHSVKLHQNDVLSLSKDKKKLIADYQQICNDYEQNFEKEAAILRGQLSDAERIAAERAAQIANLLEEQHTSHQTNSAQWWRKISTYDVVNIASNVFAFFGLINLFGGIGAVVSTILILAFGGIIQDLKKAHRSNAAWFGVIGAATIEGIYGYVHNVFFADLLQQKTHLGASYQSVALAFAVIVSGASLYVAIMTRLRASDDAEKERVEEIESRYA